MTTTAEFVRVRATRRIAAIKYSTAKIKEKMEGASSIKIKAYQKRLDEYDLSLKALDLELTTGRPMRIGGGNDSGPTIQIPTGKSKLEGK